MARMHDKEIIGITCVNGRRNVHDAASDALLAIKLCNASIPIYLGNKKIILRRDINYNDEKKISKNVKSKQQILIY